MTKQDEIKLTERVGILEDTVSELLSYLRESSNTVMGYSTYKCILDKAILKGRKLDDVL
tara:strand:+ start:156 stop:332 length:177 start_codon:yes stop_codon:yes gene_type:complete